MKILHLGDLHIGKKVNGFCMLEEQKFVLEQAVSLVKKEDISCVLIAGDVFDKPIPSVSSLELFSDFLYELNKSDIKVFIVSGNHDNLDRLSYLSEILKKSNIFIASSFSGKIECVQLNEDINIYLLPYLYPAQIKKFFPNQDIKTYNSAISTLIKNTKIPKERTNILLAHLFVSFDGLQFSDSEQKSVGLVDSVDCSIFKQFDYTALGHLHCPQKAGFDNIRYSGSILKYSFSEINQKKSFCVLDVNKKDIKIRLFDIKLLRDFHILKGSINLFLDENFYKNCSLDDYYKFILTDDEVLDAKKRLNLIYPNIMMLEFDNNFTKTQGTAKIADLKNGKTLFRHFSDFYFEQLGVKPDSRRKKIIKDTLDAIEECRYASD